MPRSQRPGTNREHLEQGRPREICMTDLEVAGGLEQPISVDIHASGTPGGGAASGGLAGSNVGDGSPENVDLENALGSGIFDQSGEDETDDSPAPTSRRTRLDSGRPSAESEPRKTRSNRSKGRRSSSRQTQPSENGDADRVDSPQPVMDELTTEQREQVRQELLQLGRRIAGEVTGLTQEVLRTSGGEASGNLSNAPLHLADLGTDHFNQEMTVNFLQIENQALKEISAALVRLNEGRYGYCERCDRPIARERLEALPDARYCIGCARKMEQEAERDQYAHM